MAFPETPTSPAPRPAPGARTAEASHRVVRPGRNVHLKRSCTIRRSPHDTYAYWRDVSNFLGVVRHALTITAVSPTESHWIMAGPSGARRVEWRAVIITDEPDRLLAWRSRDGADVASAGSVRFNPAPGDEGTEVTVNLRYEVPGGRAGAWFARVTGRDPGLRLADTLRRVKALLEAGEMPTTAGQPQGRSDREPEDSGVAVPAKGVAR